MQTLLERYRKNYRLPQDQPLTEEQVQYHLELERRLAAELLATTPDNRPSAFERCYTSLYRELPWLNHVQQGTGVGEWPALLGPPPQKIYEVGSGRGELAGALADYGYDVEATEITAERSGNNHERVRWSSTDGVHLAHFALAPPYDAVLSNQVIEHLHPDDLAEHFAGASAILRPGGRYALATPHVFYGPNDIGGVFDLQVGVGMHLREYTYCELAEKLEAAGFSRVSAPLSFPEKVTRRSRVSKSLLQSSRYLKYLISVEKSLLRVSPNIRKGIAAHLYRPIFIRGIVIVALK
jgi:SAM-dependent methyltransferase